MIDRVAPAPRSSQLLGAALAVFLAVPVLALALRTSLGDVANAVARPAIWSALEISFFTSGASLALMVLLGTPLAWWIARSRSRFLGALEALLRLPVVLPPSVAGVALLLAFGRRGVLSALLPEGASLAFTSVAVVLAQTFVAAPLYVQAASSAFRRVDARVLLVASTLGGTPTDVLLRVAVPIAMPALIAGAALAWARALGEFGATLLFAGNMEGRTQTLPLAIYTAFEGDFGVARAISLLLIAVAVAVLAIVRVAERRAEPRS